MNKETRKFVESLLLKYNSYKKLPEQQNFFDNSVIFGSIGDQKIEIESEDGLRIIGELCEALGMFEEE